MVYSSSFHTKEALKAVYTTKDIKCDRQSSSPAKSPGGRLYSEIVLKTIAFLGAFVALSFYGFWSSAGLFPNLHHGLFPLVANSSEKFLESRVKSAVPWNSTGQNEDMTCHLPVLKPFDPSLAKFNINPGPHNCKQGHPLLFKTDFKSNLLQVRDPKEFGYLNCCYQSFKRKSPGRDTSVKYDPNCVPIETTKVRVSKGTDFIRVNCKRTIKGKKASVPVDFFGFVHLKPDVETKIRKTEEASSRKIEERKVNVVILGMDAVSHMNFQRVMPKTREYLVKNLSALYLDGYTKTGGNTFPNLVSVLMGHNVTEIQQGCWKKTSDPFDTCPFVWKNFMARGYRTAYGEDAIWMGNFNYVKRGFNKIPTDYYYNGLTHELEANVGHKQLMNAKLCHGPRLSFSVHLDYLQKMAVTMNKTRRYFQLSWATAMTHDELMQGKQGDQPLLETLKWFKDEGYLEDTVFILMSDHGMMFGSIRNTVQGKYETNMPFAYFILPEWFKDKYRPAVSNLLRNRNRLTTHFDMHETLLDLSNLECISKERLKERYKELKEPNLPRGISFFLPIPLRRTCDDAGIRGQYCVCRQMRAVTLQGNTMVEEGARNVAYVINGMFVKFPQCSTLVFDRILNAQVLEARNSKLADVSANITRADDPRLSKQQVTFSLSILVRPSNASFEAKTTRHTDGSWEVQGEISRTNLYGEQSRCVTDYNLKRYCYCD